MVELTLKNLSNTAPRNTTILMTCEKALKEAGYDAFHDVDNHRILIDPDRGAFPRRKE